MSNPKFKDVRTVFVIDDEGNTVILGGLSHGRDSITTNYYTPGTSMMAEAMLREVKRNKKLLLPVSEDGEMAEVDCTSGPVKVAKALQTAYLRMSQGKEMDYSIKNVYDEILVEMIREDAEFGRAIFDHTVKPMVKTESELLPRYLSKAVDSEARRFSNRLMELNGENMSFIGGYKFEGSFQRPAADYVIDLIVALVAFADNSGDRVREDGFKKIVEYAMIAHTDEISVHWDKILPHMDSDFNIESSLLLSQASDETLRKMLDLESRSNSRLNFCHRVAFILEAQRRGMLNLMNMHWVKAAMINMTRAVPIWPKRYDEEIKAVFAAIADFREASFTADEMMRIIGNEFVRSGSDSEAWKLLSETIYEGAKSRGELAGISIVYFNEYYRFKYGSRYHRLGVDRFLSNRDSKYVRSGTIGSPTGMFFMMLSALADQSGGEALFSEAMISGFRGILTAKPSERKNFARILSATIHSDKFDRYLARNLSETGERIGSDKVDSSFVRTFFKALSESGLRNVVVEKIVDTPTSESVGYSAWKDMESVEDGLLFGYTPSEVADMIKDLSVRGIITSTILKMALQ